MVLKKKGLKKWNIKKAIKRGQPKIYTRPWWWRRRYGLWWVKRNKYYKKWKKYSKWSRFYYIFNSLKIGNERIFKLRRFYLAKLALRTFIKEYYGNFNDGYFQRLLNKHKNQNTNAFVWELERRLDIVVTKIPYVWNKSQSRELIKNGLITVNDKVITDLKFKTNLGDVVQINFKVRDVKPFLKFFFNKRLKKKRFLDTVSYAKRTTGAVVIVKKPLFQETVFNLLPKNIFEFALNYNR